MLQPPKHIAIIMDGNRRWARSHGVSTSTGHRKGYDALERIGEHCLKLGVKFLTVYAFSTENWNRSKSEVNYLMHLLRFVLKRKIQRLVRKGIQLRFLGRLADMPSDIQKLIDHAVKISRKNRRSVLNVALNYGGRLEIIDAIRRIVKSGVDPAEVTEKLVAENLYNAGEPDPDLVIRTSGERRISNYLLWQSAYSELYFTPKLWPDFMPADLDTAIEDFQQRKRNFGK